MILRRIKAHIEKENWFAVTLDFCIVVAGVFIGLQVANWNKERADRKEEIALIERLEKDFATLETVLLGRIERAEMLVGDTSDLIAIIRQEETPKDDAQIKSMLRNALRYSGAVSPPTTFSEALASGRIANLRDEQLRQKLYAYEISTDWWKTVSGSATVQTDPNSKLYNAITLSADKTPEGSVRSKVLDYDWALVESAEKELSSIHTKQSFQTEAYRLELAAVRDVLATLKDTP